MYYFSCESKTVNNWNDEHITFNSTTSYVDSNSVLYVRQEEIILKGKREVLTLTSIVYKMEEG